MPKIKIIQIFNHYTFIIFLLLFFIKFSICSFTEKIIEVIKLTNGNFLLIAYKNIYIYDPTLTIIINEK